MVKRAIRIAPALNALLFRPLLSLREYLMHGRWEMREFTTSHFAKTSSNGWMEDENLAKQQLNHDLYQHLDAWVIQPAFSNLF